MVIEALENETVNSKPVQLGQAFRVSRYDRMAVFKCHCGNRFITNIGRVKSGKTRSCGCYKTAAMVSRNRKHDWCKTRIYGIWNQMIQRCSNPAHISYKWYGAKGIEVCVRWRQFTAFLEDMGNPDESQSIDRIDSTGEYCKANCRWATMTQQQRNRRNNIRIEINGQSKTISEWAAVEGAAKYGTILKRFHSGKSPLFSVFGVSDVADVRDARTVSNNHRALLSDEVDLESGRNNSVR